MGAQWRGSVRGLMLTAGLAAQIASPAAETARRPMTVEDLWAMQRVGSPALSPDGRSVAFTVTSWSMEDDTSNGDLWLVPSDGSAPPRRLTWNEGSDGGPEWSPDGTRLAFVSKRGDKPPQLYVLAMAGGEAEPVTDLPVAVQNPRWFPDGRRLAFVASTFPDLDADFEAVRKRLEERQKDKVGAQVSDNRLFRYWDRYLTDGTFPHLFTLDLETRRITDLLPASRRYMQLMDAPGDYDISPDGTEICFSANATEPPYRTLNTDLFLVATAGGPPRDITGDNPADDLHPRYSPDGRWLVYGRTRRPEIDSDFLRLARRDRRSGATVEPAGSWDVAPADWRFSPDGKTLVFHAEQNGAMGVYAMPVAGGQPRAIVQDGTTGGVQAGPRGLLVYTAHSIVRPAELMRASLDGAAPRALSAFNDERLRAIAPVRVESSSVPGAGDDQVQAFLVTPPDFDPTRTYPMVVLLHGGPHGSFTDGFHYRWNAALFASRGYVTLLPNFHGSTGFGQAFADSILGAHGDKPSMDVLRAVDAVLARGFVDPARVAVAGGSYGGYLASWLLGTTDRFAAVVVHAGVYDLMAQFASDATWGRSKNYGAAPWEDPARVSLWSPSRLAAHFRTPTLVLHGEKDYRVPVTQGINLFGVLTGKGVPARLVVFPNENHWITKPQAARLWWSEVFAWLDRYTRTGAAQRGQVIQSKKMD